MQGRQMAPGHKGMHMPEKDRLGKYGGKGRNANHDGSVSGQLLYARPCLSP
jgi:hypothetical protein